MRGLCGRASGEWVSAAKVSLAAVIREGAEFKMARGGKARSVFKRRMEKVGLEMDQRRRRSAD